jgi:zinc transport system substrate-binding protein
MKEEEGHEQDHEGAHHDSEKGHHDHEGVDPHIWLDFANAKIMAGNIAKAFSEIDPQNAEYYRKNLEGYQSKLTELDNTYKNTLSACKSKRIIYGGHYAFGYLAKRYNLEYYAAQGYSPDAEPTAGDLIKLVEQIKKDKIKYIFYEELTSPKIAETIARETKTNMLLLNAAHNLSKDEIDQGISFFDILHKNLNNFKIGLSCQ